VVFFYKTLILHCFLWGILCTPTGGWYYTPHNYWYLTTVVGVVVPEHRGLFYDNQLLHCFLPGTLCTPTGGSCLSVSLILPSFSLLFIQWYSGTWTTHALWCFTHPSLSLTSLLHSDQYLSNNHDSQGKCYPWTGLCSLLVGDSKEPIHSGIHQDTFAPSHFMCCFLLLSHRQSSGTRTLRQLWKYVRSPWNGCFALRSLLRSGRCLYSYRFFQMC
jgi:hypothetical protein